MIKKALKSAFGMISSIIEKINKTTAIVTCICALITGLGIFGLIKRRRKNGKIKNS